jgi:hypothetical protein
VRPRLPAAVVLGTVVALVAGAAIFGAEAGSSGPSSATVFAQQVLGEATVPPGGQETKGIHTVTVRWLGGWGATLGVEGVVGAHAFYLYDEPRETVTHYVEAHLPPGAVLSAYGTHSGVVTAITETLAVSGPDEYMATLTYQVAATNGTGTQSELRIDAKTIWEPARPASEQAPSNDDVRVTGYGYVGRTSPRRPVTVALRPPRAHALVRVFDSLPLGPGPSECHENTTYFRLVIFPPTGDAPSFRVAGEACDAGVDVTQDGRAAFLSDRSCALLHAVAAVLPHSAAATKHVSARCLSAWERRGLPAPNV